ncbi:MAG: replicative DNA helicase [Lachnospira sp.]|nr:replicative DNA helicase [Lachnospira sp.]
MDQFVEKEAVRILPNDPNAECSVLSAMVMNEEALLKASETLKVEDFYRKENGIIFKAILELNQSNIPVDLVVLEDKLKKMGVYDQIGGFNTLRSIVGTTGISGNIESHCNIVREKAILRGVIKATEDINRRAYVAQEDVEQLLADTEKQIFDLVQSGGAKADYKPIRDVTMEALDTISKAYHSKGTITGVATGFTDLDRMLSGLQPSDLILIAARPSMGKTAFVLNIAQHVAVRNKKTTAVFSLEMSNTQLVNRLLSLESGVEAQKIRNGEISELEWSKLAEAAQSVGTSGLIIDDTPSISIKALQSKCRKFKLENNLGLIIIDYLQLMSGSGSSDSHQLEIAEISKGLKAVARELGVPVVALSQLSRAVEKRDDKRPIMSDLRDSGAIEQDADVVMFIYREDYYVKDLEPEKRGISEIIIAKQRNGPVGTVKLAWLPQFTKFGNLEHRHRTDGES